MNKMKITPKIRIAPGKKSYRVVQQKTLNTDENSYVIRYVDGRIHIINNSNNSNNELAKHIINSHINDIKQIKLFNKLPRIVMTYAMSFIYSAYLLLKSSDKLNTTKYLSYVSKDTVTLVGLRHNYEISVSDPELHDKLHRHLIRHINRCDIIFWRSLSLFNKIKYKYKIFRNKNNQNI